MDNTTKMIEIIDNYKKHSQERKQKIKTLHKQVNDLVEEKDKHDELKHIDELFDHIP